MRLVLTNRSNGALPNLPDEDAAERTGSAAAVGGVSSVGAVAGLLSSNGLGTSACLTISIVFGRSVALVGSMFGPLMISGTCDSGRSGLAALAKLVWRISDAV
jgi:hypothetical protein